MAQITDLEQHRSDLSIFKMKERNELQAQIDKLRSGLPDVEKDIIAERKEQEDLCNAKLSQIKQ